jgi:hypothetical protein
MIIRRRRSRGTPNRWSAAGRNPLGNQKEKIAPDSRLGFEKLGNVAELIIS